MKYIKKLIRNSKRALNQQVIKNKQEIVKYAPRLTGIQANNSDEFVKGTYAVPFFMRVCHKCHEINSFLIHSSLH